MSRNLLALLCRGQVALVGKTASLGRVLVQHVVSLLNLLHSFSSFIWEQGTATVSMVDKLLEDCDAILDDLRMHLLQAQQKMKSQADTKRHHEEFVEGAWYS